MNFLNLSLGELVGLSSVIVTGVVALYLLDRSKRRQVVSTLRFWAAADVRTDLKHRKRQEGIDIIDLGMGNPTDVPNPMIIDKLCEAARDERNHRYSVSKGLFNLRREVALRYARLHGVELDPETDVLAGLGFLPHAEILRNKEMLYIAIGILGATVMPHNLYLHSSIVQTRAFGPSVPDRREALRYSILDSTVALGFALFINAAILILGAAAFHTRGLHNVAEIAEAYKLLSPVLGASLASTIFAVALLASGQNSTLTGTLAGQIVMEGFLEIRLKPWVRRLITRSIAIFPAAIVIGIAGESKVTALIVFSQVVLSFQLPFAIIPLIQFTGNRAKMGEFVNSRVTQALAWMVTVAIIFFNGELLWLILRSP